MSGIITPPQQNGDDKPQSVTVTFDKDGAHLSVGCTIDQMIVAAFHLQRAAGMLIDAQSQQMQAADAQIAAVRGNLRRND